MRINRLSHIRKWLLLYLVIMVVTVIVLFAVIYTQFTTTVSALALETATHPNAGVRSALPGFELRLLLVLTGGVIVCGILGYIWMGVAARRIGRPVQTISRAMAKLARGQLNETVAIDTGDELGQIASEINELAANLQELLLHVWKQTGQCLSLLEHVQSNPDLRRDRRLTLESLGYLKQLAEAIEDLQEMAKAYVFYEVSIEGTKTHAISQPGGASNQGEPPKDYN